MGIGCGRLSLDVALAGDTDHAHRLILEQARSMAADEPARPGDPNAPHYSLGSCRAISRAIRIAPAIIASDMFFAGRRVNEAESAMKTALVP